MTTTRFMAPGVAGAFAVLFVALACAAAPGFAAVAAPPVLPAPVQRTLGNGLRVAVFPSPRLEMVQLQLLVPAGLTAEPAGAEGVAYVTAELLRSGTTSRDPVTFSADVDATGGSLTSNVGRDYITENGVFLSRDFELGMQLLGDAVLYPLFDKDQLQRVKTQALRQLAQQQQAPSQLADDQLWRATFGTHPYARAPQGAWGEIAGLDVDRIRSFWSDRYRPDHAVLAIAGDITPERAFAVAEEVFGQWSGHGDLPAVPPAPGAGTPPRIRIMDRPGTRAEVRIGFAAPARNAADEPALLAARALYDAGPGAGVFGRDARASYVPLAGAGLFTIALNAPSDSTGAAVRGLFDGLRRLATPVPANELTGAQHMLRNAFPLSLETLASWTSSWLSADFSGGGSDYFDRFDSRIAAVTPASLATAAGRWLDPSHATVVVVGPAAELRPQLESMGAVEVIRAVNPDSSATPPAPPAPAPLAKPTLAQRTRGRALALRMVAAHGGLAKLRAIRDSHVESIVSMNIGSQQLEGNFVQLRREPDRMVFVTELGGVATRQTLAGNEGWQLTGADTVARFMAGPNVEALKSGFSSDLHHLLLAAADPRSVVWERGRGKIDSIDARVLMVETPGRASRTLYVHPVTFRLIAFDQGGNGQGLLARRKFSDFQTVGGILWPYHEVRQLNGETVMDLEVKTVRFNSGVAETMFQRPAGQ